MRSVVSTITLVSILVLVGGTPVVDAELATAVYYSRRLDGRRTASGERFNSNALTAAHKTYPLGTRLRLTTVRTKRSVVVRVNDRGPFTPGRDISVTRRAARQLGMLQAGHARVRVTVLHRGARRRSRTHTLACWRTPPVAV
jgi:rare lipoprotein A